MIIDTGLSSLEMRRGDTLRLEDAHGATISCANGSVWVTRDGDSRDMILSAGQKARIDGPGMVVVQAFETSYVAVAANALSLSREARLRAIRAGAQRARMEPSAPMVAVA